MKFYLLLIIAIVACTIAVEAKRKCNENDVPMTKRCKKKLKLTKKIEDGVKKNRKRKNKRRRKHKNREEWPLVEQEFTIDYQELFAPDDKWLQPYKSPTVVTPPTTDPAFITVQTEILFKRRSMFKSNLFKRNTEEPANIMSKKFEKSYTMIGNYGFHSPRVDIQGYGVLVKDPGQDSHYACSDTIENTDDIPSDGSPWVAVIERGLCDFFYKIRLAKLHNASAVIIFNQIKSEELPIMNTVGTRIPSVIIHKEDGHELMKVIKSGKDVFLNISLKQPAPPQTSTHPPTVTSLHPEPTSSAPTTHPRNILMALLFILITMITTS